MLDADQFSQAYGMNQGDVVVGTVDHQAFAALPR